MLCSVLWECVTAWASLLREGFIGRVSLNPGGGGRCAESRGLFGGTEMTPLEMHVCRAMYVEYAELYGVRQIKMQCFGCA